MKDHDYIEDTRLKTPVAPKDTWQERLYYEHEELCDRIDKLEFHIGGLVADISTIEDLYIMVYQLDAMKKYRNQLEARADLHDIALSRIGDGKSYSDDNPQF
jgi:hypothetical protein